MGLSKPDLTLMAAITGLGLPSGAAEAL